MYILGFLFGLDLLDCLAKLVGARSTLHAASDTFQARENILSAHAYHQLGQALGIAVTSSIDVASGHTIILHTHFDVFAACAVSFVEQNTFAVIRNNLILLQLHYSSVSSGFMLVYTV